MRDEHRWHGLRERGRGVGFVVLLGTCVCLVGLAIAAALTWVMA
jgi:hypothetical protein